MSVWLSVWPLGLFPAKTLVFPATALILASGSYGFLVEICRADAKGKFFFAANYPEAVGIMTAIKEGIALSSVRRPLEYTKVESRCVERKTAD
ncbi:MAG: hypothetical protein ACYS1A_10705, partial [Planctomycetota bacterium]